MYPVPGWELISIETKYYLENLYGWGRKAFLGVLDEGNYYRPEKLKFEKCLKIAAGAEHILLLAEKADKNETVLLDKLGCPPENGRNFFPESQV